MSDSQSGRILHTHCKDQVYEAYLKKRELDKVLILSLLSAHIYEREDFENPEKLLCLKDNLEQAGYLASLSLDQEFNLYTLAITKIKKK